MYVFIYVLVPMDPYGLNPRLDLECCPVKRYEHSPPGAGEHFHPDPYLGEFDRIWLHQYFSKMGWWKTTNQMSLVFFLTKNGSLVKHWRSWFCFASGSSPWWTSRWQEVWCLIFWWLKGQNIFCCQKDFPWVIAWQQQNQLQCKCTLFASSRC